jgi:cyclophilin family peptidyl-prolyl cis-trans isomerase
VKLRVCAVAFATIATLTTVAAAVPDKAAPRVIFHTVAGDLVFALYPTVAPRTVEQFLALTRAGVYDTTHFFRLESGYVLQTGVAADRVVPLTAAQRALIRKLPREYGTGVRHTRGVLSLARPDNDPDGGETSFSIILGNASHLDGKYTIFGELESGGDVLALLERVPVRNGRPTSRLGIDSAEVVESLEAVQARTLRPAQWSAFAAPPPWRGLVFMLTALLLAVAAAALWEWKLRPVLFLSALIGGFVLFLYLTPLSAGRPWLGTMVLLGAAALFRALSFFESRSRGPSSAR